MKIQTRKFGEVEIDDDKILTMPEGLPGFPGFERFALLEDPKSAPFCWFQSVEEPNLALIIINPYIFKPDYQIDLEGFITSRGWEDTAMEDLLVYAVVNITDRGGEKQIMANLVGPLIINSKNNETIQVAIANSMYSHQHDVMASVQTL